MVFKDKLDWIIPLVRGRKVLDLGCVRHAIEETEKAGWLHGEIRAVARSVRGVDYLADAVARLRERGYDVVCANVETMDLGDRYEVVVAGDLIEHLDNVGNFLERVRGHLDDGGVALLTTPNPVNPLRFVSVLLRGEAGANAEHTCWFTEQVLRQLVARHGMVVGEVAYVDDSAQYYGGWKWLPFVWLNALLVRLRPAFAETLCVAIRACPPALPR
jgi:2-polyprenyl-3-methyl-5-hydroxy-6-metoxy-1,4-benzoquinol methylase